MPEYIRALIVISVLATAVFACAKVPVCATTAMTAPDFERRRNLWFGIVLAAFLAHNFWVYILAAGAMLVFAAGRETNKLAMYFFILLAVPPISSEIGGLGIIRHFFSIDYLRLLALTVLLPAFLILRRQADTEPFGRSIPDRLLLAYLTLQFTLMLTSNTFTNTLRQGIFYAFIDVFLPYYVASRSLNNLKAFRDALMSFVVAALVLSAIGAFEFVRHWLLYASLDRALAVPWDAGSYLARGESLRAEASAGHPIVMGYVIAVAAGFFMYFRAWSRNSLIWLLGIAALLAGLVAPLSRGPWLGVAVMLAVYIATGPLPARTFTKFGVVLLYVTFLLLLTPMGRDIVDYLPFVGTVEAENVTYRERLVEISTQLILANPFFGVFDYIYSPAMQELKQGQGIIDIVNTYVGIGLSSGLVGLSIFVGFFVAVGMAIRKAMRELGEHGSESYLLGRILLATLAGIMFMIFTVSSILTIPVIYWSVAGLGVGYVRMLALARAPSVQRSAFSAAPVLANGSYHWSGNRRADAAS